MLSEEAVRKNCVLVYELLDEVIDNGFPQSTSSEALKEYVLNVPIIVKSVRPLRSRVHSFHHRTGPSAVSHGLTGTQSVNVLVLGRTRPVADMCSVQR